MSNHRSIFTDLEIDYLTMLDDPEAFSKKVYHVADELQTVLKSKGSISEARQVATETAAHDAVAKDRAKEILSSFLDTLYEMEEEEELNVQYHMIQLLKEFIKDSEVGFHSRAREDMILRSPNMADKKLAFDRYTKLREGFESFREFAKMIHDKTYAPLKSISGNFGGSERTTYPAYRIGSDVYHNYRIVAEMLGWKKDDFKSHMDLVEKMEETGHNMVTVDNQQVEVEIINVTL